MHRPVFKDLNFPFLPFLALALSFVILLSSLARYVSFPLTQTLPPAIPTITSWRTYRDAKYHYQFDCPVGSLHKVEEGNGNGKTIPYKQEICFQDDNQVRILVLDNTPRPTDEYLFQKHFSLPNGEGIVIIQGFDQHYFDSIVTTFKFVGGSGYSCPTSEWVDCMPGPGPAKPQCQPDFLNWAKANCPGFQGAAL